MPEKFFPPVELIFSTCEFDHTLLMAGKSLREGQAPLIYFSVGGDPAANRRLPDSGNFRSGPRGHKAAVAGQHHVFLIFPEFQTVLKNMKGKTAQYILKRYKRKGMFRI